MAFSPLDGGCGGREMAVEDFEMFTGSFWGANIMQKLEKMRRLKWLPHSGRFQICAFAPLARNNFHPCQVFEDRNIQCKINRNSFGCSCGLLVKYPSTMCEYRTEKESNNPTSIASAPKFTF